MGFKNTGVGKKCCKKKMTVAGSGLTGTAQIPVKEDFTSELNGVAGQTVLVFPILAANGVASNVKSVYENNVLTDQPYSIAYNVNDITITFTNAQGTAADPSDFTIEFTQTVTQSVPFTI